MKKQSRRGRSLSSCDWVVEMLLGGSAQALSRLVVLVLVFWAMGFYAAWFLFVYIDDTNRIFYDDAVNAFALYNNYLMGAGYTDGPH